MDKIKEIEKVVTDIRELRQRMIAHNIDLVGLDVRFPETGETSHIEFSKRD